jgi:hypothetical protein
MQNKPASLQTPRVPEGLGVIKLVSTLLNYPGVGLTLQALANDVSAFQVIWISGHRLVAPARTYTHRAFELRACHT